MAGRKRAAPAVSIVTATYNRSAALACAIESVRRQSFADWELIVVGDACTDDTAGVVARFADARIRFINLGRNFGDQAGPNNIGVAEANAPLVAFLNHDDLWLPNHLKLCREALLAQQADLVYGTAANIQADTPLPLSLNSLRVALSGLGTGNRYEPGDAYHAGAPASCWLMRRDVHLRLRGWRPGRERRYTASQDFMFRAWRAGYRLHALNLLTLVIVASGTRIGSYATRAAVEQEWMLERIGDPAFAADLAAAAAAVFNGRSARRVPWWTRTLCGMLARLGLNPLQLDQVRRREAPGAGLARLKRIRGLPVLAAPAAPAAAMRFDMVRMACRTAVGETIAFGAGRGGARFLASGWSRPELTGVWNDGRVAELLFDFGRPPAADLVFHFLLRPYAGPRNATRTVEISAYGASSLAVWKLAPGAAQLRLLVPAATAIRSLVLIRLRFPDAASPRSLGISADRRELAMHLQEIRIEAAKSEALAAAPAAGSG